MAKYYVLLTRESATASWCPQFGDRDRATVAAERSDSYLGKPADGRYFSRNLKILVVNSSRQSCIDYAIARLNGVAE